MGSAKIYSLFMTLPSKSPQISQISVENYENVLKHPHFFLQKIVTSQKRLQIFIKTPQI